MHIALPVVALVVVVATVAGFAEHFRRSAPLLLVIVGIVVSFVPGIPQLRLDPDVVLFGLLPPLLYAAAIRTSLIDFRANRRPILLLAVGLVIFSTFLVGLVTWWAIPGMTLAAGLAFGAVVAPPDAVAATAIARRVGLPRRIVTILEGESLINDATALVALNTAAAAITAKSHHVQYAAIGGRFALAAGGGLAVGLGAALALGLVRRFINDPVLDTTLSFVAPFAAFLPAQAIHASGVLAVVVTGLILGHRAPYLQSASSRIAENTNWRTVGFLLENAVFLLIGLQLRGILDGVRHGYTVLHVLVSSAAILLAAVAVRILWVFGSAAIYRYGTTTMRAGAWSWQTATVVSWAGMRGVVTLAAVFLLPAETPNLPSLRLAAFVVVSGTLVVQGLTLPALVRRLDLPRPDLAEDALQTAALVTDASRAGLAKLEEIRSDDDAEEVLDQLRERASRRSNNAWERLGRADAELETPSATYRRLRVQMLAAERSSILTARSKGTLDDEVLRGALAAVDVEESLLDRIDDAEARMDNDLVAPATHTGQCEHLHDAPRIAAARTPGACEDCLREGTRWVHLRMCLTCGNVGCCDSSVGRHAERHFSDTEHPVMRSVEPGEAWRWCYVDELLG